jgi:hypothetical protein
LVDWLKDQASAYATLGQNKSVAATITSSAKPSFMPPRFSPYLFATLLAAASFTHAEPRNSPVPGGVAVIPLGNASQPPQAHFGDSPLAVIRHGQGWAALLGIPLDTQPGPLHIQVDGNGSVRQLALNVQTKDYPVQRLTVRNQNQVTPDAPTLARIEREKEVTDRLKRHFSPPSPATDFALPAKGRLSSRFGLRRIFNGEPRNPHGGLDLAVGSGTPVHAPAAGTVLNIGNYFFNGNTVFLNHGQGLISAYMHLSRVDVKEGQRLAQGAPLGASGMTGRATGPHLHWAVFLNGTAVEPELFLPSH